MCYDYVDGVNFIIIYVYMCVCVAGVAFRGLPVSYYFIVYFLAQ